jgi:hypothetical protein
MAGQGEMLVTMDVPESTPRGSFVSGAGTLSAVLKGVGVIVEGTDAGETKASVQIGGTAPAIYSETITAGASLKSDATGELAIATGDATDNGLVCAIALEDGAANELRSVKLV